MTLAQALQFATAKLSAKNIDNPRLEAEILLSGVLKKPREFLFTHPEAQLSKSQIAKLERLFKRRLKGEPIAYLTGYREFYGLDFMVNKNVLIPRPETELMVEEAMKPATRLSSEALAKEGNPQPVTLMDVGTGSGCIIIALAKELIAKFKSPASQTKFEFLAADISKPALLVAEKNAELHGVKKNIKFIHGNLLKPMLNYKFYLPGSNLIILANLPYGWRAWKNNCSLDSAGLKHEPEVALFTDKNGLWLYEKLFEQTEELRAAHRELRDIRLLCEFDPRQTVKIKQLIKKKLPKARYQIKKDLAGLNRLAIIKI